MPAPLAVPRRECRQRGDQREIERIEQRDVRQRRRVARRREVHDHAARRTAARRSSCPPSTPYAAAWRSNGQTAAFVKRTVANRNTIAGSAAPHASHTVCKPVDPARPLARLPRRPRDERDRRNRVRDAHDLVVALTGWQPSSRKTLDGAQRDPLHDPCERPDDPAGVRERRALVAQRIAIAAISHRGKQRGRHPAMRGQRSTRWSSKRDRAARHDPHERGVDSRTRARSRAFRGRRSRSTTRRPTRTARAATTARGRRRGRDGGRRPTPTPAQRAPISAMPRNSAFSSTRPPAGPSSIRNSAAAPACRHSAKAARQRLSLHDAQPVHGRRLERPPRRRRARIDGERDRERARRSRPARRTPSRAAQALRSRARAAANHSRP